jgi:hypothetical protein
MSDALPRRDRAAAWHRACRIAVVAVLVGVFLTWLAGGPVGLDGTQGPNNGWLAVILALLALPWLGMLERGSWVGVLGVLGSGAVICWTALENWLDGRAVLDTSAGLGLVLVVAGGAVLAAAAVAQAVELVRGELRHRESRRGV